MLIVVKYVLAVVVVFFFHFCGIGVKILKTHSATIVATSVLKKEAVCSSKPLIMIYHIAQCTCNIHCHQNQTSHG